VRCCDLAEMSGNPIMRFPYQEIINTELFIDGKQKLYIHSKGRITEVDRTSGIEATEIDSDAKIGGNETQ